MNVNDCEEGKHYLLVNEDEPENSVVYCYRNPDFRDGTVLGFGFNLAQGSGWLPLFDIVQTTVISELSIVPIDKVRELVKTQCIDGNWDHDEYMRGLANGLILALATITDKDPIYKNRADMPEKLPT